MKRNKFFKLWLPLLALLIGHACQEDDIHHDVFVQFNKDDLNEQGLAFVEALQTREGWEKEWNEILKVGTPEPNHAIRVYSFSYEGFFILPVMNDKEITHVVFYSDEEKLGKPLLVGEDTTLLCPDYVCSFFSSGGYNAWEEEQYFVKKELVEFVCGQQKPCDQHIVTKGMYYNCIGYAEIWVRILTSGSTIPNGTLILYGALEEGIRFAQDRFPRIRYGYPCHYGKNTVEVYVANNAGINDLPSSLDALTTYIRHACYFVTESWYYLRPFPTVGGSSSDPQICSRCNKKLTECTCPPTLSVSVGGSYDKELLQPYDITVQITGKNSNKVDIVAVQMRKVWRDTTWKSLGYGTPSNGVYKISRSSFNPGEWQIRAGYELAGSSGVTYSSNVVTVREQWPHVNAFKDNAEVGNFLKNLWKKAVDFAKQNQEKYAVREYGAFIFLSPQGTYSCKEVEPGPIVYLNTEGVAGSLTLVEGDYADLDDWDNPKRQIPLVVGTMHTHYPLTWAKRGVERPVGPSQQDRDASQVWPGLVYDYSERVEAGDPEENPKNPLRIWTYGPERRAISK